MITISKARGLCAECHAPATIRISCILLCDRCLKEMEQQLREFVDTSPSVLSGPPRTLFNEIPTSVNLTIV